MLNNENGLHRTPITSRTNRFFVKKKETKERESEKEKNTSL